jgi:hypothetical protein
MPKTTVIRQIKRLSDVILSTVKADYGRNKSALIISSIFEFNSFSTGNIAGKVTSSFANNNYW